jgi:hypothetical protein
MVRFKKKKTWDKPFSEKIARRVKRIPTNDLLVWADQAVYEVGKLISIYERHRTEAALKELLDATEALHAVINELNNRTSINI